MMWFFLAVLATLLSFHIGLPLLAKKGFRVINYRGLAVIYPGGLLLLPPIFLLLTLLFFFRGLTRREYYALLFLLGIVLGAGLLDDFFGTDTVKGFKGHFANLRQGNLSTGILKIMCCTLGAFFFIIGMGIKSVGLIIFNVLLALLCINTFNLLDKRPGRCLKGIIVAALPVMAGKDLLLLILVGAAAAALYYDLGEKMMLGDTGANFLGSLLAAALILKGDQPLSFVYLVIFILANGLSELISFSSLIEKNYFLQKIDLWGRK